VSLGGVAHDPGTLRSDFGVPGARLRPDRRAYVRSDLQNFVE
jgi:hypothetical protein